MKVLMLSSSRKGSEEYLEHARPFITEHIRDITDVLFIPYAGVTIGWDEYTQKVQMALPHLNIKGIHEFTDPIKAVQNANVIFVGGGNTFNLLHQLYRHKLTTEIQNQIKLGIPFVGWSAGSNICGASIRTTNDMPIVQPISFNALNLVPFQINPHYTDYQPPGYNGESRAQRIQEFCELNPNIPVIGIREGGALLLQDTSLVLVGELDGVIFKGKSQITIKPKQPLDGYLC
ncbi:dipeptidase PepE [Paraglaciecola sp.]|uniref:dipeptidase PepE n=1 Tax=Paraglaciecola sp. TaxID=1920173 RepID=UPI003264A02D